MLKRHARVTGVVISIIMIAVWPHSARAGSGEAIAAPRLGVKATSGLLMTVDTTWVDGFGYRPVRVDISTFPLVPSTAERTLLIEVTPTPHGWGGPERGTTVSQFVELPQGSTGVSVTLAVPQQQAWSGLNIVVSEDGYMLEDLSLTSGFRTSNANTWYEGLPAILFIDRDAPTFAQRLPRISRGVPRGSRPTTAKTLDLPDIRQLVNDIGYFGADTSVPADDASLLTLVSQIPQIEFLPPQDLPERWIELSSVDVAFISLSDLQSMQASNPPQWKALRAWLASGPTLCVYGVGSQFERLEELERLLELPACAVGGKGESQFRNWQIPSSALYGTEFHGHGNVNRQGRIIFGPAGVVMSAESDPADPTTRPAPRPTPPSTATFLLRDADLGTLVAIADENPFPGDSWTWQWLFNTLTSTRTNWSSRHGLSFTQDNGEYWNFLIPGVGLAPVTPFRILITLFVVLIGPVNYFALRRWKRLYLLLVTVPAGAALVTLGLFAYALLSDGLGVQARVRSFTQLDQTNGRAVSWSRQTYYAGLAPSRGLAFPSDTAVYPIEQFAENYYDPQQRAQQLEWRDYEQRLTRGFLSSRVMGQFMVVRSHQPTQAELRVLAPTPLRASPRVENLLGSQIHQLLLVDDSGQAFWAENIPRDATAELQTTTTPDAYAKMRPIFSDNLPQYPEGFGSESLKHAFRYYTTMGRWQNGQSTSVLERKLHECLMPPSGIQSPRSYLAIVESSPSAPLGYAKAREQASFHVVAGTW
jgi:hypothetical protein